MIEAHTTPPRKKPDVTASMEVVARDIVITDPCYLLKDVLWSQFLDADVGAVSPQEITLGKIRMLIADTIYGDWMCTLRGKASGKPCSFGKFTADAGLVCVAVLGRTNPDEVFRSLPRHCYTIISQFTGRVLISHRKGVCHVEGSGRRGGEDVEFVSRQIG